jgi:hypothetical protein
MSNLPNTSEEADERLIVALQHYVVDKEMPLRAAKCLMTTNISNKTKLKATWKRFLQKITIKA